MPAQENFTTTLQVPSDRSPNVLVLWDNPEHMSSLSDVQEYRVCVNQHYEGPVRFGTSRHAHRELMARGFKNANMPLKDLTENAPRVT